MSCYACGTHYGLMLLSCTNFHDSILPSHMRLGGPAWWTALAHIALGLLAVVPAVGLTRSFGYEAEK